MPATQSFLGKEPSTSERRLTPIGIRIQRPLPTSSPARALGVGGTSSQWRRTPMTLTTSTASSGAYIPRLHCTLRHMGQSALDLSCISLTFVCVQCRLTVVDGAKSLAREYSFAYPLSRLFRCYRHLLADLQKTATGRAAAETFKNICKMPPTRQQEVSPCIHISFISTF